MITILSLKFLIPLDIPSDPASALGHKIIEGKLVFFTALRVLVI